MLDFRILFSLQSQFSVAVFSFQFRNKISFHGYRLKTLFNAIIKLQEMKTGTEY